jgi:hypothetical protein
VVNDTIEFNAFICCESLEAYIYNLSNQTPEVGTLRTLCRPRTRPGLVSESTCYPVRNNVSKGIFIRIYRNNKLSLKSCLPRLKVSLFRLVFFLPETGDYS